MAAGKSRDDFCLGTSKTGSFLRGMCTVLVGSRSVMSLPLSCAQLTTYTDRFVGIVDRCSILKYSQFPFLTHLLQHGMASEPSRNPGTVTLTAAIVIAGVMPQLKSPKRSG